MILHKLIKIACPLALPATPAAVLEVLLLLLFLLLHVRKNYWTTSASYYVMTYTTTGSSRNDIEMDQIQEMLLSGHLWVIVLIPQPFFYVGWALALGIIPALTFPMVLLKQVQYMEWPADSHFHPTLDLNYATGALFLYLDPSLRLFNTDKCWQGPYICALQPYQLKKASSSTPPRDAASSSCHYLKNYIELSNLSCKLESLTSLPLSQTVEIHHYTKDSMRMFEQFVSSAHTQPPLLSTFSLPLQHG
jgi:hypothetical protein